MKVGLKLVTLLMVLALPMAAFANSNSIPYGQSFEGLSLGDLDGSQGWEGGSNDVIEVIAETNDYTGVFPLPNATHLKVLNIETPEDGTVSNIFDGLTATDTFIDMMIKANPWDQTNLPSVPSEAQLAMYVNTNGSLMLYAGYFDGVSAFSNDWIEFSQTSLTGQWARLTLDMNYSGVGGVKYLRVLLDSLELTNALGLVSRTTGGFGGPWFATAYQTSDKLSSLQIGGHATLDDLVVTNANPIGQQWTITASADSGGWIDPSGAQIVADGGSKSFTMGALSGFTLSDVLTNGVSAGAITNYTFSIVTTNQTIAVVTEVAVGPNGSPSSFYSDNGISIPGDYATLALAELGDDDGDGALNWEEWLAGTLPKDADSAFVVLDVSYGVSNVVTFYATTNSGVASFGMYRAPDLASTPIAWSLVATGISLSGTGTNVWGEAAPGGTPIYRPAATNTAPSP